LTLIRRCEGSAGEPSEPPYAWLISSDLIALAGQLTAIRDGHARA